MVIFVIYTGEDLKPTVVGPPSGGASRTPYGVLCTAKRQILTGTACGRCPVGGHLPTPLEIENVPF